MSRISDIADKIVCSVPLNLDVRIKLTRLIENALKEERRAKDVSREEFKEWTDSNWKFWHISDTQSLMRRGAWNAYDYLTGGKDDK